MRDAPAFRDLLSSISAWDRYSPICAQSSLVKASPSFRKRRAILRGCRSMLISAILAEKCPAAKKTARQGRAKPQRQRAPPRSPIQRAAGPGRRTTPARTRKVPGRSRRARSYIRRVAECSESRLAAERAALDEGARSSRTDRKAKAEEEEAEEKKRRDAARMQRSAGKKKPRRGAPGGHVGDPEAHRRRAGSAATTRRWSRWPTMPRRC